MKDDNRISTPGIAVEHEFYGDKFVLTIEMVAQRKNSSAKDVLQIIGEDVRRFAEICIAGTAGQIKNGKYDRRK